MRIIESRRFVAGSATLKFFLVEEKGRLPFRVRLKSAAVIGVVAGFATEAEAQVVLDDQSEKAVIAGWTQVPAQVRLALDIPAPPSAASLSTPPPCAHPAIQAWLPKLAPGKSVVCPQCGAEVGPSA